MASKEIHSEALLKEVKKTQELLGKYIKHPPLSDKNLMRPPFRFLHDVVKSIMKETGYLKDIFSDEEINPKPEKCTTEWKRLFLNKLIITAMETTGASTDVKPSKILSGSEPEKTNRLFQILALGIGIQAEKDQKNVNGNSKTKKSKLKMSDTGIRKDLLSSKVAEPVKDRKSLLAKTKLNKNTKTKLKEPPPPPLSPKQTVTVQLSENPDEEKELIHSASAEEHASLTENNQQKIGESSNDCDKGAHNSLADCSRSDEEHLANHSVSKLSELNSKAETEKEEMLNNSRNVKMDKEICHETIEIEAAPEPPAFQNVNSLVKRYNSSLSTRPITPAQKVNMWINDTSPEVQAELESLILDEENDVNDECSTSEEEKLQTDVVLMSPSYSTTDCRDADDELDNVVTDQMEDMESDVVQSHEPKYGSQLVTDKQIRSAEIREDTTSKVSKLQKTVGFVVGKKHENEDECMEDNDRVNKKSRPDTPFPKPHLSTRPPSARLRPPPTSFYQHSSVSSRFVDESLLPSDGAVPNVIILESKEKDTKSDDEYFVINEAPLMGASRMRIDDQSEHWSQPNSETFHLPENQRGYLVNQIIATQQELENTIPDNRTGHTRRLQYNDEIERLKDLVQRTARKALPITKLLDSCAHDLHSVAEEHDEWRKESKRLEEEIGKAEIESRKSLQPLEKALSEIEENIMDRQAAILATRMSILRLEERLEKKMSSLDEDRPSLKLNLSRNEIKETLLDALNKRIQSEKRRDISFAR